MKTSSGNFSLLAVMFMFCFFSGCEREDEIPSEIKTETVTDIDGNVYRTVKIGSQLWMAENLKTTRYRNGDTIKTTENVFLDLSRESRPTYQWIYRGDSTNVEKYGRLYTWFAVKDTCKLCPEGWHVPDNSEWAVLIDSLGGLSEAGGRLKEEGIDFWLSPNTNATDESEFSARPGGYREYRGTYQLIKFGGYWWSSTEKLSQTALGYQLYYSYKQIKPVEMIKRNGLAVRCVKD